MKTIFFTIFAIIALLFSACEREKPLSEIKSKQLSIVFEHHFQGENVILDTLIYTNAANNLFLINEIKYFISDVCLYSNGQKIPIDDNKGIHYVDTDIPISQQWEISQNLAEGIYDSLSFTFGFTDKNNISRQFPNAPENTMAWPDHLGGGYHYMMINGKFLKDSSLASLNAHLGRGQIYRNNSYDVDSLIGYVDNSFVVNLPINTILSNKNTTTITIIMNIENWFQSPFIFDFLHWGSHIMQKQPAMQMLKENGKKDVFTIK